MEFISMTSPSSRGLGQQPLTLRTGVQIPLGTPLSPLSSSLSSDLIYPIVYLTLNGLGKLTVSNAPERMMSELSIGFPQKNTRNKHTAHSSHCRLYVLGVQCRIAFGLNPSSLRDLLLKVLTHLHGRDAKDPTRSDRRDRVTRTRRFHRFIGLTNRHTAVCTHGEFDTRIPFL